MEELINTNKISPDYFFIDDKEKSLKKSGKWDWRRIMPLIMALVGLILMAVGIYVNRVKVNQNTSATDSDGSPSLVSGSEFSQKVITVDIGGAVESPGVFKMKNDSRIQDVLITAGGLSAKADRMYVSKNINLAQRVFDGMKLYFPFQDEGQAQKSDVVKFSAGKNDGELIGLNSASMSELDQLPGVGSVTINKIIAGRPYQDVLELVSRKIIGKSLYEKIKDLLSTK